MPDEAKAVNERKVKIPYVDLGTPKVHILRYRGWTLCGLAIPPGTAILNREIDEHQVCSRCLQTFTKEH